VSILTGFVAAAITSPAVGAAAAVATAGALALRRLRPLPGLAAVGLLIAAGTGVVIGQALHAIPESSNWPSTYDWAGVLVWMAVVALGAHAVVSTVTRQREDPSPEELSDPLDSSAS
jgi:hypothetical protein